jgi:hypothetical protein
VGSDGGVTAQALYRMYTSSASGPALVDQLISKASTYLSNTWRYMYDERNKLLLLHVLKDQRQLYGYTNISRSIPWEWDPSSGRVLAEARQSCSWTMCVPKLLMADYICRLYTGINASLAGFPVNDFHLTRAPIVWDMFMRATTHAQAGRRRQRPAPWPLHRAHACSLAAARWPCDGAGACCWRFARTRARPPDSPPRHRTPLLQVPMPTCCQWAPGGDDYWCASPSADAVASSISTVLSSSGSSANSPTQAKTVELDLTLFPRIRLLDARVASLCSKDLEQHVSEAEQMVHELHVAVIGVTAQLLGNSPQFRTDYRRGLSNVGLQCVDRVCQSILGTVGTALGYAGWLEIVASALVLLTYFRLQPSQRVDVRVMTAIATDAPELPGLLGALPGRASGGAAEPDAEQHRLDEAAPCGPPRETDSTGNTDDRDQRAVDAGAAASAAGSGCGPQSDDVVIRILDKGAPYCNRADPVT